MASLGKMVLKLAVDGAAFGAGLTAATQRLSGFSSGLKGVVGGALVGGGIGAALGGVGAVAAGVADAIGEVFGAMKAGAVAGVQLAAALEQSEVAFGTLLGSMDKGKALVADLIQFSDVTPFDPEGVTAAGKSLLAFGVPAENLLPTMRVLGDISAGTGKDLSELSVIFGQIRAAGKLMGGDLLQLSSAGALTATDLGKHFGVTAAEARKMVEEGKVGFNDVAAIMEGLTSGSGRFADGAARQSQTLSGMWSNLQAAGTGALTQLGQALIEGFDLKSVVSGLTGMTEWIKTQIKPVVIPIFQKIRETIQGVWDVIAMGWQQFGAPAFESFKSSIGSVAGEMPDLRAVAINTLETISLGVNTVVNALKIAGGAFLQYLAGPGLKGIGYLVDGLKVLSVPLDGIIRALGGEGLNLAAFDAFSAVAKAAGDEIKKFGKDVFDNTTLDSGGQGVRDFFQGVRDAGFDAFDDLDDYMAAVADGWGYWFDNSIDDFMKTAGSLADLSLGGTLDKKSKGDVKLSGAMQANTQAAESAIAKAMSQGMGREDKTAAAVKTLQPLLKQLIGVTEKSAMAVGGLF